MMTRPPRGRVTDPLLSGVGCMRRYLPIAACALPRCAGRSCCVLAATTGAQQWRRLLARYGRRRHAYAARRSVAVAAASAAATTGAAAAGAGVALEQVERMTVVGRLKLAVGPLDRAELAGQRDARRQARGSDERRPVGRAGAAALRRGRGVGRVPVQHEP